MLVPTRAGPVVPIDIPSDVPVNVPFDIPSDVPVDIPLDVPIDVPIDISPGVPIIAGVSLQLVSGGASWASVRWLAFPLVAMSKSIDSIQHSSVGTPRRPSFVVDCQE